MYYKLISNYNTNKQILIKILFSLLILLTIGFYLENTKLKTKIDILNTTLTSISKALKDNVDESLDQIELLKLSQQELEKNWNKLDEIANITEKIQEKVGKLNKTLIQTVAQIKEKFMTIVEVETEANVKIFNLNKPLEPNDTYAPIICRKSAHFQVTTSLCIHDVQKDIHVSGSILRDGVWESSQIQQFTTYLSQHPDWLVLDVGAQIGQYSLFAAKMGRDVVTVEPFYDNIIRLHKAATLENIQNKITLITNAISNKRNEIKMLQPNDNNIGGQSLLTQKDKVFKKDESNKYLVETILFDDIIPYLPKRADNQDYQTALLKLDIEGFEPYAFVNASKLFERLDIKVIFMEWGNFPQQTDNHALITQMIDFLLSKNFIPYDNGIALSKNNWLNWPWDIIWKKNGF